MGTRGLRPSGMQDQLAQLGQASTLIPGAARGIAWPVAVVAAIVAIALVTLLRRRADRRADAASLADREAARERGSDRARLHHPDIDLARCIGCGLCVDACPEGGVLSLLHGQAVIVHGSRCVGHGLCAEACPVGAIGLTLGDLSDRDDLPALDESLEAVGVPGLFLAGEISGFALVRTAVRHGSAVADAAAQRLRNGSPQACATNGTDHEAVSDLLIVGAGPGGLSCALRAKELELDAVTIDQADHIGGTVATYPRRKLVMTQPVHLPLYGRLPHLSYEKEQLVEIWTDVAGSQQLPVRFGTRLTELAQRGDGTFEATTTQGTILARNVCLAIGRRGSPRKLGVPGEDLPKVAYALIDAASYTNRDILVVGGGDSAIEAALGLAAQPGNTITLSYRKKDLFRLKARNETRIRQAIDDGSVRAIFQSTVAAIDADSVELALESSETGTTLPNDDVFIFAGGVPPFEILRQVGVSFDPKDHPGEPASSRGSDLIAVLTTLLATALALLVWGIVHGDYYRLAAELRQADAAHALLRPTATIGLLSAILACMLMACNGAYLLRRSTWLGKHIPGGLRGWMSAHVLTGVLALECVLLHAGFTARWSVGGHALAVLIVVVGAGAIGRYLYAFVPRAANGGELSLHDVRTELAALSSSWDQQGRALGADVRAELASLTAPDRWRSGLLGRILALVRGQHRLRRSLRTLRSQGARSGLDAREIAKATALARRAFRLTLVTTHYEEIRGVLSTWRFLHRWLALLMVLLAAIHIASAVRFADLPAPFAWRSAP
ncbi:MAG: NAD(P)-binding domain-containing protein [Planctomycetota bacterium]